MRFRTAVLSIMASMLTGCAGKIVVTRIPTTGAAPPMQGIYYALPKTVVKLDEPIERILQQPGKYVLYLPLFFPAIAESGSFVRTAKTSFKISKASISTFGEPDPQNIFYLKITGNGPVDRAGLFEYTEQGTVSGAAAQADNATTDIVFSVLNTAAGLAAKSFGAVAPEEPGERLKACTQKPIPHKISAFHAESGSAFDGARLMATYCGLDTPIQAVLDKADAENNPDFNLALTAYAQIFTMQKERSDLRNNPQAFSLDAALKDFDAAIGAALAQNFTGKEKKDTWTFTTELRDFSLGIPIPLIKFHESEGLCSLNSLPSGDYPPKAFWFESASYLCDENQIRAGLDKQLAQVKDPSDQARLKKQLAELTETLNKAKLFTAALVLNPPSGQQFQLLSTAEQSGERGFRYRIPAAVDVILSLGEDVIMKSNQSIAQFGLVASLPSSTGGKSTAYSLKFYEATGALKSFNVTSKAILQKGTADALGADVNTLAAAKQTADKAQRTKEDELTVLDRQSKILADKKAIYENCKALNAACGGFVPAQVQPEQ